MARQKSNKRNYSSNKNSKSSSQPKTQQRTEKIAEQIFEPEQFSLDPNYVLNFAKAYLAQSNDPYIQNMMLKDLNMSPRKLDVDKLKEMMKNPKDNEKALRDFSQYLENAVMQFKRLVLFFGSLLVFDHYLEPTNADEDDMKTPAFQKSYKKALSWLEKFNLKKQLPDVMRQVLRQDAVFYYVRESKDNIFLQEMPIEFCKIVNKTEYGYQYAFNMTYFLQVGVSIKSFAPEFEQYFEEYQTTDNFKKSNQYPYWIELNPLYAPCFKFDETVAGIVPPFMSMFPDSLDIDTYREITKAKGELDVFKVLLNKIPMHGGDGKTRKATDLALDANTAGKFSKVMEDRVPNKKFVKVVTTPFDSEFVDFQRSESGNPEIDSGNKLFYNSAAINPNIIGGDATTASGIDASLKNAASLVYHMYPVFERFINAHLKMNTGKYRWKIHLEGTRHDRDDRMDRAFKAAGSGFPKSWVASAMGKTPEELVNLSNFENSIGLVDDILKPFISAHTLAGNENKNGRPESKKVSDAGEKTRDNGSNVR